MISRRQKEKSVGTKVEDARNERHISSQETGVTMSTHQLGKMAQKHKGRGTSQPRMWDGQDST